MKEIIRTAKAPAAIGPYSQAARSGNTVYFSGQLGIDPATGKLAGGGVKGQAEQSLKKILALLEEIGASINDIVKTTVFIVDMADFPIVNAAYSEVFRNDFPARSCVAVKQLPLNGFVEMEATVVLEKQ